jgi:DUF1365 family protein
MTRPAAQLWFGRTAHTREQPFKRSFAYRIAMLEIDIDRMAEADGLAKLFSVGRSNMVAFRETDHGARDASVPLSAWAEARFAEAGIDLGGGPIRLLTFPRVLGIGFAPISVWLGHSVDGELRGAIYEVHNTFGETHAYVSALNPVGGRQTAEKEFHVSPFFDVTGEYRFTLKHAESIVALTVENISAGGRSHVASLTVQPRPLTSGQLLKWMAIMPISGLGVMFAIHWQALILLLKGAKYRDKPDQRVERTTLAKQETARLEKTSADVQAYPRKSA